MENNKSDMILEQIAKLTGEALHAMNEIRLYVLIAVAGKVHGKTKTAVLRMLLYGLQLAAASQLINHGVENPLNDDNSFSDNYRAWFAWWTNHINTMHDDLKDSFVVDFIAGLVVDDNDLTKYYPKGNWENVPMGDWMNLNFPNCLEPLIKIGFF